MDAKEYQAAVEYEKLTQAVYQAILNGEGQNVTVEHNVDKLGRSGVAHQVDVYWQFSQAGLDHIVLMECKNYASSITLEKVRNFFAACTMSATAAANRYQSRLPIRRGKIREALRDWGGSKWGRV
jgi:hypothetical protein